MKVAYLAKELPPDPFPLEELSGAFKHPTMHEYHSVYDIQHLVQCMEHRLTNWAIEEVYDYPTEYEDVDECCRFRFGPGQYYHCHKTPVWVENVYRSMYRSFLVGAYLYGPYNKPFFLAAKEGNLDFIELWGSWMKDNEPWQPREIREIRLSGQQAIDGANALAMFPVYTSNSWDNAKDGKWPNPNPVHDPIFSCLAKWIIEDGVKRGEASHHDAAELEYDVESVMRIVASCHHIREKIVAIDSREEVHCLELENYRKVTVVKFGSFVLEEIFMPRSVEDQTDVWLISEELSPEIVEEKGDTPGSVVKYKVDVIDVFVDLQSMLGSLSDDWDVPSDLQFFSYTLSNYFNSSFNSHFCATLYDMAFWTLANPNVYSVGSSSQEHALHRHENEVE